MSRRVPLLCRLAALAALAFSGSASAGPAVPPPRYDFAITLDCPSHGVQVNLKVTWTNPTTRPLDDLVFNFYPQYQVPKDEYLLLAKSLEMLRLQPSQGIDRKGQFGVVRDARVLAYNGRAEPPSPPLPFQYEEKNTTALHFKLPRPLPPGESVTVELNCSLRLPNKQGRWGHWEGVTFVTNALPVVAYCDDSGWRAVPFVPWHQPWFNEAGLYTASVTLPADQTLVTPAVTKAVTDLGNGLKRVDTEPFLGRDFSFLCSSRYREFQSKVELPGGKPVTVRVFAFPEHEFYANESLRIAGDAIATYSQWFAPYPYPQFTVVESYFGWNGNECAGMVMIDERVFGMPHLGVGYVEYLLSHETCHQWWYNLVGTNGYAETFMDEAPATYFTHRYLDRKRGRNNAFLDWPKPVAWLPNIYRDNYRFSSMYAAIGKGEMQPAVQEMSKYGHVVGLFTGAYDRGSKVLGMIEDQLGEAAFMEFTRCLVAKYSFRVLQVADFQRELEAFTGRPWGDFFDKWVFGKGMTDWQVVTVDVRHTEPLAGPRVDAFGHGPKPGPKRVSVLLRQAGEIDTPTHVGFRFGDEAGYSVRIPVVAHGPPFTLPDGDTRVEPLGDGRVRVEMTVARAPTQVTVDPDRVLLDCKPGNNYWKIDPNVRLTPLYTTLDETDLTNDYDRWNFAAGPWAWGASYQDPWYTRSTMLGVRAGAYRTQEFSGGAYAAFRTDYNDAVLGVDGLFDHCPFPKTQIGFNYERRVLDPIGTDAPSGQNRAVLFGRYILSYGSSFYLPPMQYVEAFTQYQDNFLPYARTATAGGVRPDWWQTTGVHYRLNLYTPYWDPEEGFWIDATYGGGVADVGSVVGTHQIGGQLAGVVSLPEGFGRLTGVRLAGRATASGAVPDRGLFFALGGSTLFRGFDLAERQGSALWVGSLEVRYPLYRNVVWDCLDHTFGVRNVWAVGFYDVGDIYANGHSVGGVAHALGAGLRLDMAVFSFIERATVRFDVGKTVNAATGLQFWFGVQQAF